MIFMLCFLISFSDDVNSCFKKSFVGIALLILIGFFRFFFVGAPFELYGS
ncbi:hypothetical protein PMIT1342_00024 [Prochlorococcus marinus str. MIT 1342]|nr:hypothetical protein PMIT1342_00024 [Prochlorococcus marinus str. MIT 1342]